MKTKTEMDHENYVISFTDGTIKIGSTKRHTKRVREVVKQKIKDGGVGVVTYYLSDLRTKEDAYRVERDTCYLLKSRAIGNAREWLRAVGDDIRSEANYVKMTMEMFAHGVGLTRSRNHHDV